MAFTNPNAKPKTVSKSKKTAENIENILASKEGKALNDELKAKAQEVFDALGKKYNVKYDIREGVDKDTKQPNGKFYGSVSLNCYDANHTVKGKDGQESRVAQTVTLMYDADKKGFNYVQVSSYDGTTSKTFDKVKDQYPSVITVREALEKANLLPEFLTKEGAVKSDKTYTPAETLRYEASKAVQEINKTAPKTADGKNQFYVSELKDTSFKAKDGTEVAQETFRISSHGNQFVDVNVRDGKVGKIDFVDAKDYNKTTKQGLDKKSAFTTDYLKTLEKNLVAGGLDKGFVEILDKMNIEFGERTEKSQAVEAEAPTMDIDEIPAFEGDEMEM